tara:strand:- start:1420 stop:1575 length:156 start_codon:yes stop_codon:yes gene_type:complete
MPRIVAYVGIGSFGKWTVSLANGWFLRAFETLLAGEPAIIGMVNDSRKLAY